MGCYKIDPSLPLPCLLSSGAAGRMQQWRKPLSSECKNHDEMERFWFSVSKRGCGVLRLSITW